MSAKDYLDNDNSTNEAATHHHSVVATKIISKTSHHKSHESVIGDWDHTIGSFRMS